LAAAALDSAVGIAVAEYDATLAMADRLREDGKRAEAIRMYEAASDARPDRVYPLFWLTTLVAEERDYQRAFEYGQRGLAIDPNQIGLLLQMGSIASWGHASPFKKGTAATKVIATGVKVFGIGSDGATDEPTAKPSLVLVRPAVNVMGKSKIRLENPHGWYCFVSNVTVAGSSEIELPCDAHIASAKEDGTSVGAADDSKKGVTVFGALRVTRYGCSEGTPKS